MRVRERLDLGLFVAVGVDPDVTDAEPPTARTREGGTVNEDVQGGLIDEIRYHSRFDCRGPDSPACALLRAEIGRSL